MVIVPFQWSALATPRHTLSCFPGAGGDDALYTTNTVPLLLNISVHKRGKYKISHLNTVTAGLVVILLSHFPDLGLIMGPGILVYGPSILEA